MNTYKTRGIALKSQKLGEADKIITFLTTEGKVSAVAKGIRRTSSKFGGRLEPGNDLQLVVVRGRALDTVTQVHVAKARPWLRTNLDRLNTAYAIFELADKFTLEESAGDCLLELTSAALDRLEAESRLSLLLLTFDIKAVAMSGFFPYLKTCVVCGAGTNLNRISAAEGGMVCDKCLPGRAVATVRAETIFLIEQLLRVRFAYLDSVKVANSTIDEARRIIWEHIVYHVHSNFKARDKIKWPTA